MEKTKSESRHDWDFAPDAFLEEQTPEEAPGSMEHVPTEIKELLEEKQEFLDRRINAVMARAQELSMGPSHKSRLQRIIEKIKKIAKAGIRATAGVSALSFALIAYDHELTRWSVSHEEDPQTSRLKYEHEDPETTHVINVLSGKERLTDEEELALVKESLTLNDAFPYLVANGIWERSSDELMQADKGTIISLLKRLDQWEHKNAQREFVEKSDEQYFVDHFTLEPGIEDHLVYETLWRLMEKAGNPKLRLSLSAGLFKKYGTGHYDPITNTVYITPQNNRGAIQTMIAELSHGKQFNERPYYTSLIGIRDFILVAKNSVTNLESLGESYDRLYNERGALEYYAHEEIEPVFTKEYEENTKEGPFAKRTEEQRKQFLEARLQFEKDKRGEQDAIWDEQYKEEAELFRKRDREYRNTRPLGSTREFDKIREIADRYDVLLDEVRARAKKGFDELDKKYSELKAQKGFI